MKTNVIYVDFLKVTGQPRTRKEAKTWKDVSAARAADQLLMYQLFRSTHRK